MYFKTETFVGDEPIFLVNDKHLDQIAVSLAKDDTLATVVDGRKIVKAGTIYPANDATAKGILRHDYDVTDGSANASLIVRGSVLRDVIVDINGALTTSEPVLVNIEFVDKGVVRK